MLRLFRLLMLGMFALSLVIAHAAQTVLILNSPALGLQQTFTPADGQFTATAIYSGAVQVSFHTPDYSHYWTAQFGPANSPKLVTGLYERAQTFPIHSPTHPGLYVYGDFVSCDTGGRFYVSDIAFNLDGSLSRLAIDFEQDCTGIIPAPPLYGSVRYNSASKLVPRLAVGGGSAMKGNAGTSDGQAIVSLSMPNSLATTVQFATVDGSALAGKDYLATSGTVTFPPGVTAVPITIPIIGDRLARGNKSLHVKLSNPAGAIVGIGSALLPILDPNGNVTVFSTYGQPGDFVSPGLKLLTTLDGTITTARNYDNGVDLRITDSDFWFADFAAPDNAILTKGVYLNAQRYPFQAPGLPGLDVSGAGRGCNTLTGNFNVLQASYDTTGNVKSFAADFEQHCEGSAPALFGSVRVKSKWRQMSVSDALVDGTQSTATFTVTLNPSSPTSVSVRFSTVDGTAISGTDYAVLTEQVSFSPGETEKTVVVPLLNPTPGRKFYGQLANPSGAPLWISQGSATF
jgi:hypothetical protein